MFRSILKPVLLTLILVVSIAIAGVQAASLKKGSIAPAFSLKSLQGKQVSLADMKKNGLVMLVFWEPECMYCFMHIQELNALHTKYHNNKLTIAAINFLGEYEAEIQDYVTANGVKYMMLTDRLKNIDVAQSYNVFGTPTIVLISTEGTILYYGHKIPDMDQWLS